MVKHDLLCSESLNVLNIGELQQLNAENWAREIELGDYYEWLRVHKRNLKPQYSSMICIINTCFVIDDNHDDNLIIKIFFVLFIGQILYFNMVYKIYRL